MVRWDEAKHQQLQERRGISFDLIAELYEKEEFEAIVKHETRSNQQILVVKIDGYCCAVPCVIEEDRQTLFFNTAYPSRKLHKRYGGKD